MASKVLLISANRCTTPDPVFPLGLSFINAAVRRAGHEAHWLDCWANGETLEQALRSYQPDFVGVSLRNIDDVMIRTRETFFKSLAGICQTVQRVHPCPVILGGSGYTLFPIQLLQESGADFGIQGEGEASFLSLLEALEAARSYEGIPGLVYRRGRDIVANPAQVRPVEARLSSQDRPAELAARYLRAGGMLNVQTQRGCAHTCCYCTYPLIEGRVYRRRPPELIAEELAEVQAQGARYVFIVDSIFNSTPEHVMETSEAILRRKLTLQWGCFLRPQGLTRELVKTMARAGLTHAEFGSDSFCDSVLQAYGKAFTFEDILISSDLVQRAGLDYCHFLICGGPGESPQTLRTSFENSRRLAGAVIMAIVGMRIYPGTTLARRALREGVASAQSDLLTPVYYVAPGLTAEEIFRQLQAFKRSSPNWIVGDPEPGYARLVQRLRGRGVVGPLWSYLALSQRIRPRTEAPQPVSS
jgi:radical SAM superfamily enzyme YgiQ (UPF0313 family)